MEEWDYGCLLASGHSSHAVNGLEHVPRLFFFPLLYCGAMELGGMKAQMVNNSGRILRLSGPATLGLVPVCQKVSAASTLDSIYVLSIKVP